MCEHCPPPGQPRPWVSLIRNGRTMKELLVTNIPAHMDDDAVLLVALPAARETKSSLFGWTVTRLPDNPTAARVVLHTD